MQTTIVAGRCGIARSVGDSEASRVASERLLVPLARRRGFSARKRSWSKYHGQRGSDRQVSPQAVDLAESRIAGYNKLNSSRRRAVFYAVQCLSRYDREEGARLPQRAFSSDKTGRFIQEAIVDCGLATCTDWDSWKPTGHNLRTAKARGFIPCFDFLWADTGQVVVSNFEDYCNGEYERRAPLHEAKQLVIPCTSSGVEIPANVTVALQRGTGVVCDFTVMRASLLEMPQAERGRKLGAALASMGRVAGGELRPIWKQHEWGRLYSSKPAAINMPTTLLSSLVSVEGLPLWCVDFSSFELRIACMITGQRLPEGDAYQHIAEPCGLSRKRVKAVINPMLHGQTHQQCWYARENGSTAKEDRPLVENELRYSLPHIFAGLNQLRGDAAILQREGARIFFPCMAKAMIACEIKSAGLPKHDGWIFAADESQAKGVQAVFQIEAERIAGVLLPARLETISIQNS